jgi:cytosine deaminase
VNARIMNLDDLGLRPGALASLVVLEAGDPVEALRLRAPRRVVISRGKVVSERAPAAARLALPGRPATVDRRFAPRPRPGGA